MLKLDEDASKARTSQLGEGRRELSWIWRMAKEGQVSDADAVKVPNGKNFLSLLTDEFGLIAHSAPCRVLEGAGTRRKMGRGG